MATTKQPKLASAKALLSEHGLPLDANSFFNGLEICGMLERCPYESTTGSGEIKHFSQLIGDGLKVGENKASGWHEFKTEPKFYPDRFAAAYLAACMALHEHAKLVCSNTTEEGDHESH